MQNRPLREPVDALGRHENYELGSTDVHVDVQLCNRRSLGIMPHEIHNVLPHGDGETFQPHKSKRCGAEREQSAENAGKYEKPNQSSESAMSLDRRQLNSKVVDLLLQSPCICVPIFAYADPRHSNCRDATTVD